ncbi:hypothetical protein IHE33_10075 [Mycetohabitans endofungorum]
MPADFPLSVPRFNAQVVELERFDGSGQFVPFLRTHLLRRTRPRSWASP